jgi:hypothetical protein
MNQPPVFISCVSPEFRQTRSRVAGILTRLGYTPVIQGVFAYPRGKGNMENSAKRLIVLEGGELETL